MSAGRTVPGTPGDVLGRRCAVMAPPPAGGVPLDRAPTTSATEKCRYWRARPAEGTRVSVTTGDRAGERSAVGVPHTGPDSPEDAERWRAVWLERLGAP